jgi:uncharacterized membrane protein
MKSSTSMSSELWAIVSAAAWAADSILVRKGTASSNPSTAALVSFSVNAAVLLPYIFYQCAAEKMFQSANLFFVLSGIIQPAIVRVMFYVGIVRLGVSRAGPIRGTSPFFSVAIGFFLFQERPPLIVYLDGLSTIAGTWLVSYERAGETKWRAVDLLFPLGAAVLAHADQHHAALRHRSYRPVLARRRENLSVCIDWCRAAGCGNRVDNRSVGDRSYESGITERRCSSSRLELRQCDSVAALFENDLHRHIDMDLVDRAADDVAAKARSLVEIDPRRDVRDIRSETAQRLTDDFADDREGKYFSLAADFYPFELIAGAIAANRSRAKNPGAAVLAFLNHQLARFRAVPERLIDGRYLGKGLFDCSVVVCHMEILMPVSVFAKDGKLDYDWFPKIAAAVQPKFLP